MDVIKDTLQALADANGGRLDAPAVVEAAKDENSPLHACFDWNVNSAAYKHWVQTARALIRSVKIVYRVDRTIVKAPVYIRDPDSESGYRTVASIRSDKDHARDALIEEFKRVRSILDRAQRLAKVLSMDSGIETLISGVDDISEQLGATH